MIKRFESINNTELTRDEKIDKIIEFTSESTDGESADRDDLNNLDDDQLDIYYNNLLMELNEGVTTASPGSGTAVGGGPQGSFVTANGTSYSGGDSGSAFATNGSISGMGSIVSSQPSSVPGDVRGSTKGSGDVGSNGGVYMKQSVMNKRKNRSKMSKRKPNVNKVDDLYTTNYKESTSNGKIIQSWKTFNESKKLTFDEYDDLYGDELRDKFWDETNSELITDYFKEEQYVRDSYDKYLKESDNFNDVQSEEYDYEFINKKLKDEYGLGDISYEWFDDFENSTFFRNGLSQQEYIKRIYLFITKTNESLFGNIARLRTGDRPDTKNKITGRMDDDNYASEIFEEMKEDFIKFDKDFKKVNVMGDSRISYIFGEFHPINNSSMSGNSNKQPIFDNVLNRKVSVTYNKSELLLNLNSLEKMFGVGRGFKFANGFMKIEDVLVNPNYRPGFNPKWNEKLSPSEKEMVRMIDRKDEHFKITHDLAKEIYDYFNKEYIKQYPQLKNAQYKNQMSIRKIENGKKPNLGYVHQVDKNGENITYEYNDLNDKKKIENYVKNNVILKGENKDRYPITYFTKQGEEQQVVKDNMLNMSREDIDKQNTERVYSFKK